MIEPLNEMSRISVVVPVRNGEQTLGVMLAAVRKADPRPHEIIVVDDASTDRSREVAAAALEGWGKVSIIPLSQTAGPAKARNTGAQTAEGEIILYVDADVVIPPDTISIIMNAFRNNPSAGIIQSIYTHDDDFRTISTLYQQTYYNYYFKRITSEPRGVFATYCAAIKKDIFFKCGGFDQKITSATIEDEKLGYKILDLGFETIIVSGLVVRHLVSYTVTSLVCRRFKMAGALTKIVLEDKVILGHVIGRNSHHPFSMLSGLMTLLPALLFGIISLFFPAFFPGAIIFAGFSLVLQVRFLAYIARTHGWLPALACTGIAVVDMLAILAGIIFGTIKFFLKRRS